MKKEKIVIISNKVKLLHLAYEHYIPKNNRSTTISLKIQEDILEKKNCNKQSLSNVNLAVSTA